MFIDFTSYLNFIDYTLCLNLNAICIYHNADVQKKQILEENNGKSGIYRWKNIINGKTYIGSSVRLRIRLSQYFNVNHLERNKSMRICRALLKYGYSNFSLEILEYCDSVLCLEREKHHIDHFNPEYNISRHPSSPFLGLIHSKETKDKIKLTKLGISKSEEHKLNLSLADPNIVGIEVTDLTINKVTIYHSMRAAARALGINMSNINNYLKRKQKKPYKGLYTFKKI